MSTRSEGDGAMWQTPSHPVRLPAGSGSPVRAILNPLELARALGPDLTLLRRHHTSYSQQSPRRPHRMLFAPSGLSDTPGSNIMPRIF